MLPSLQRHAVATAIALLGVAFREAPALAQVETIRLTYQSEAGCPEKSRFVDDVSARTDRANLAAGDAPARGFEVVVSRIEGGKILGVLRITDLEGSVSEREVMSATCQDVVSALALMTALAIDPRASPIRTLSARDDGDAPDSPDKADARSAPAADRASSSRASLPARAIAQPWRWSTGIGAQVLAGFEPGSGLGGGAFMDFAGPGTRPLVPSFRASVFVSTANASFATAIGARLVWIFGRAEVCPAHLLLQGSIRLGLCGAIDAGVLRTEGTGLPNVQADYRPWIAPGAFGRVQWSLPGGAWVEGGGGLSMPLERYVFYYERAGSAGDSDVSRIPALAGALTLGGGYQFP